MKSPLPLAALILLLPGFAVARIEYVLHITCDGLRADALKAAIDLPANASAYPGFRKLMAGGAYTFQARCDFDYSETIPNHTGVVTGRPVSEPAGFTPAPFTADPETDICSAAAHGLTNGDNVLLAGTLPGGFTATTVIYRVSDVTPGTFKLSTYNNTTGQFVAVDITSTGAGTGTFVRRVSHGFSANFPAAGDSVHKLTTAPLAYKYSTFDMAHDRGLSTAIIAGKTRLNLYRDSYNATLGAVDLLGTDNGRNKVDFTSITDATSAATLPAVPDAALGQITGGTLRHYTLLHITDCDTGSPGGGHSVNWNSAAWINNGTKVVDGYLNSLLTAIEASATYNGRTAVIVTADHGGGQSSGTDRSHTDAAAISNINIPVFLWGPGIKGDTDAYTLFRNRVNPGAAARPNSAPATAQPLRNSDTGNIAMTLLGLPPVTGSYFRPDMGIIQIVTDGTGGITISWPVYLAGYTLQTTIALDAPWTPVAETPVESGTEFRVSLPADGGRRFWRLQQPQ